MAKKLQKKHSRKKSPRPKVKKADLALDVAELRAELQILRSALEALQARLNSLETKLGRTVTSPWQPILPWPPLPWPQPEGSPHSPTWSPNTASCKTQLKPVYGACRSSQGAGGSES